MQIEAVHFEKVDEKQPLDFISKKKNCNVKKGEWEVRAVDHVQKIKLFYYRIDNIQNLLTGAVPRAKIVGTLSNQVIKFVQ